MAFFRWPDISVTCFNKVFETWEAERVTGTNFLDLNRLTRTHELSKPFSLVAGRTPEGTSIWSRAREWSLQELLSVSYPYWVLIGDFFILLVYCYEQDMTVLLYAALPETMKTPGWFSLLFLLEVNLYAYGLPSLSLLLPLHILFSEKLGKVMRALEVSIERRCRTAEEARGIFGQMRTIQLLVNLFNVGHRNVIYCIKLMCIAGATLNGYAAIVYSRDNLIFTLMAFFVLFDFLFLSAFVYEKAFGIPDRLEHLKLMLKAKIRMVGKRTVDARVLKMQIESIPLVGLRVGNFHMLERASTPIFIHYVINNIVNLLVMHSG